MSNSDQPHEQHADGIIEAGNKAPAYFYLLFFGLIAWGVVFMGYYLFSGWSSDAEFEEKMASHSAEYNQSAAPAAPTDTTMAAAPATAAPAGASLFAENCAGCHGAEGKGGFGSNLTSASYVYGKDAASIKHSIAQGRGDGKMPAFGEILSAADIDTLVDYALKL